MFGNDPTVGAVLAALLASLTCLVAALLATRLLRRAYALATIAVLCLNPAWILFTSVLATEHLAGLLLVSIIALVILRPLDLRTGALLGVLEALLLLTRADIGFAAMLMLAFAIVRSSLRPQFRFALVTVATVILTLSPWIIRNEVRFGEFIPTSANAGLSFYRGTFQVRDGEKLDPDPPPPVASTESPRGYDNYYWRLGVRHIREDPLAWLRYNVERLKIQNWFDAEILGWAEAGRLFRGLSPALVTFIDWLWRTLIVLAFVAVVAVLTGSASRRDWLPLILVVAIATAVLAMFVGAPRRHYPLIAEMTLLAGLGAQSLAGLIRTWVSARTPTITRIALAHRTCRPNDSSRG